jgi:squalene-hopene/tetraprenyl-beta-curcumene cyclase
MSSLPPVRLDLAYQAALSHLLNQRAPQGHWTGELSTSALSTATAVSALALVHRHPTHETLIAAGLDWLIRHQNPDGGWGDTVVSVSNISTSMLVWAAFHLTGSTGRDPACLERLQSYLHQHCGKTTAEQAEAIRARYGKDRTFAVPILTTCALAGLLPWQEVPSLPFELACFPQSWFRFLRLPVVSYALPALIAIGQAIYHHRPPWNPVIRAIRASAVQKSLRVLETIQPSSGGFLEATPLTSFVTLSLASIGQANHPVARKGIEFLANSVRSDGSWPIDTNLATWVTTLSVNALAAAGELAVLDKTPELTDWLLRQQFKERHPYTGADPGGWGWTDLPGSVPDSDDTPGALLALAHLRANSNRADEIDVAAHNGLRWLCSLQNRDGGWPTFCRGWGNLPFDRSGPDLTAHALRALAAWMKPSRDREGAVMSTAPSRSRLGFSRPTSRGLDYLARTQHADGSWLPLWFGNQFAVDDENPTYGTARVLAAYRDLDMMNMDPARRGVAWLLANQNADGGWGGTAGTPSSMEETALAVEALLAADAAPAVNRGLAWLVQGVESGGLDRPAPIGFYFAKLWYFEKLYPIIFTVSALGRACKQDALRQPGQLGSHLP